MTVVFYGWNSTEQSPSCNRGWIRMETISGSGSQRQLAQYHKYRVTPLNHYGTRYWIDLATVVTTRFITNFSWVRRIAFLKGKNR